MAAVCSRWRPAPARGVIRWNYLLSATPQQRRRLFVQRLWVVVRRHGPSADHRSEGCWDLIPVIQKTLHPPLRPRAAWRWRQTCNIRATTAAANTTAPMNRGRAWCPSCCTRIRPSPKVHGRGGRSANDRAGHRRPQADPWPTRRAPSRAFRRLSGQGAPDIQKLCPPSRSGLALPERGRNRQAQHRPCDPITISCV